MEPDGEVSAAMRYKEIIARARQAADDLRDWERTRAEELGGAQAAARAEIEAAREREQEVEHSVHHWWRMAADNLTRLSWWQPSGPPEPATDSQGEHLRRHTEEIRPAYHELTEAIRGLGWRAR